MFETPAWARVSFLWERIRENKSRQYQWHTTMQLWERKLEASLPAPYSFFPKGTSSEKGASSQSKSRWMLRRTDIPIPKKRIAPAPQKKNQWRRRDLNLSWQTLPNPPHSEWENIIRVSGWAKARRFPSHLKVGYNHLNTKDNICQYFAKSVNI